jgi:hypothetical protein
MRCAPDWTLNSKYLAISKTRLTYFGGQLLRAMKVGRSEIGSLIRGVAVLTRCQVGCYDLAKLRVIDGADVIDRSRRKLLTTMLVASDLNQAVILATGEEAAPKGVPSGVKFVDLASPESKHSNEIELRNHANEARCSA